MTTTQGLSGSNPTSCERSDTEKFRVVVFGHIEDTDDLKRILIESAGLQRDDAVSAVRTVPGILPLKVPEGAARAVADELGRHGIRAICLPETEIPRLDHAEIIHHAGCQQQGLEVVGIHGERTCVVPWCDVSLLSVGSVPQEDGRRYSAEQQVVLHAAPNPYQTVVEKGHRHVLVLWIVCERPWRVFRLVHNQMNYEYLGARQTTSATQNFCLFVADLAQMAKQAYLTPATRAFLNHGFRRQFEFHSADELQNSTAFHVVVTRTIHSSATVAAPPALSAAAP
jgi:hypothetical protein